MSRLSYWGLVFGLSYVACWCLSWETWYGTICYMLFTFAAAVLIHGGRPQRFEER